jgi:hypothetical protein
MVLSFETIVFGSSLSLTNVDGVLQSFEIVGELPRSSASGGTR